VIAVALVCAALLTVAPYSPARAVDAEVTAADGLSFNYFTDVSLFGGPSNLRGYGQTVNNPPSASPSVECPSGGGSDSVTDPDGARAVYGPAVIFGGRNAPENTVDAPSGPLTSSIECQLGEGGHVTASTSVTLMPPGSTWVTPSGTTQPHLGGVGPGPFIADEVHSTCTANADGTWTASATIVNGTLDTRYDAETQEPVATEFVPTNPGANYTREGTIDHVGDSYRIVFNEQSVNADGSVTVNAAHMYLLGPTAVGDMVIGSSTCGPLTTAAPASSDSTTSSASTSSTSTTSTPPPSSTTTSTSPPPSTATTSTLPGTAALSTTTSEAPPEVSPPPGEAATTAHGLSALGDPGVASVVRAQTAAASSLVGGAFGYHVEVGLFGGPPRAEGPAPTVTLPSGGSASPVTAQDPDGAKAQYGPAVIFGGVWPSGTGSAPPSGPITVSTQGKTGIGGSVTSSAAIVLNTPRNEASPGGVGPGPLIADEVHASCTADAAGTSGSARFVNGKLETKYDAETQEPVVTEDIPANPAPNLTRTGTIDHVGDNYRIVFNEQKTNPDGSLTVSAAHMYLLGPIAVGELIVGQVRCGVTASAAGATTTAPTTTAAGAEGSASGSSTTGSAAQGKGQAPASSSGSTSVAGSSASSAGRQATGGTGLARTGGQTPTVLALTMMLGAVATWRWVRQRPPDGRTGSTSRVGSNE
jgi:hypothetical protein